MASKSLQEQIADADARGNWWLAIGNAAAEEGDLERAEACYAKGQYWLDRYNRLKGNA